MQQNTALMLDGVVRRFDQAGRTLQVLNGISLSIRPGEMVALVGPSGAGKSTLLQIAGLLERPTEGEVYVGGQACGRMEDAARTEVRRHRIGFVYQFHHLLPEFSALENVMLPQLIAGLSRKDAETRARELLTMVGLAEREDHRPARLSGGEQQRVAIVRAMANVPNVLLADEPTGNLDPHTAEDVFGSLRRICHAASLGALIATHNLDIAARMDRILELRDGMVVER
ncbi:MAG: ABC transporter ATP-binding protein [Alphaproteobacteria bacterium]|nr:ABC transporter ATP-binding protein [Alphaproteobacteria bacterium]MBU0886275.1 ABC transporter ATP-binding protein [Alphaproteobacteria bacterium]MBU1815120.1 ABC transporter ATP-binding protein [Alphaproteobacteria bacterium]MBU2089880.1 ABC transporter ATP-binding protein [Alphaproteobacteria bacterium]